MDECSKTRWNSARTSVENELQVRRHRASNDARVLQMTWLRLREAA